MSGLPPVDYELAVINAFLTAAERPDAPLDEAIERAQDHGHAFRTRLEAPVRVAFAGFRGSGKSSLVNLLTGQDVLPTGRSNFGTPAIIVRHATAERTIASWWDRPNQAFTGLDLDAAFALAPDIVSVEIDCEVLKDLWLIDISGLGDAEHGKRAIFALMRLADVMLWCSNVTAPVDPAENEVWRSVPARLMRNSLLVLTHSDAVSEEDVVTEGAHFAPERIQTFRDTIPIATTAAMQALHGEGGSPEDLWHGSGADHLVSAIMTAAFEAREDELGKIRRGIVKFIQPAQDRLDAIFGTKTVIARPKPRPTSVQAPAAVPAAPIPAVPAAPPVAAPAKPQGAGPAGVLAWNRWKEQIAALLAEIEAGSVGDNSAFVEAAQHAVDGFRGFLADEDPLGDDGGWLIDEFEKANDLLILMQFETAADVAIDAARVLVQLGHSLKSVAA